MAEPYTGRHRAAVDPAEVGASSVDGAAVAAGDAASHTATPARAGTTPPARAPRSGLVAEILARATRPGQVRVLADPDYDDPRRA
jgi:hypothetical protein